MNETGTPPTPPMTLNVERPFKCGMPLILFMALDAAIKKGEITIDQAIEIIKQMHVEGDKDA